MESNKVIVYIKKNSTANLGGHRFMDMVIIDTLFDILSTATTGTSSASHPSCFYEPPSIK